MTTHPRPQPPKNQRGLTLIELMVSLVLGMMLIAGAISVIIANGQSYRTNSALSQVQESGRLAFELMARSIREAGTTGCGHVDRLARIAQWSPPLWWEEDWTGILGFNDASPPPGITTGAATGNRIAGTDALMVQGIEDIGVWITEHDETASTITINTASSRIAEESVLLACGFEHAAIFQVTDYTSGSTEIKHEEAQEAASGGNCSDSLDFITECAPGGQLYSFPPNSQLSRLNTEIWYIGANGRDDEGGRSLYRRRIGTEAEEVVTEEIVPGISNMNLAYRLGSEDEFISTTNRWEDVTAVRLTLTATSTDERASTDLNANEGRLSRNFTAIIGLRNRPE